MHGRNRAFIERQFLRNPFERRLAVVFLPFAANPFASQAFGDRAGCAGAKERVKHHIAALGRSEQHAVEQAFRLLRGMHFRSAFLEAFPARADRQDPVAAHLQLVIQCLHRAVIEMIARLLALAAPQQGLMRIGEARAFEVRHRIGFTPDNIIEDPEAQILQDRAYSVDIVIAADDPQSAIGLQDTLGLDQPVPGELVVQLKTVELVPVISDCIHFAAIGAVQIASQLKVIRRVSKNQIDAGIGNTPHSLDAITIEDLAQRQMQLTAIRFALGGALARFCPQLFHSTTQFDGLFHTHIHIHPSFSPRLIHRAKD